MDDYLEMAHSFEAGKRRCEILRIIVRCPVSLNETFKEMHRGKSIRTHLYETPKYKGKVTMSAGKLILEPHMVQDLVEHTLNGAMDHLKSLFQNPEIKDVFTILVVGGFARLALELIKQSFPEKKVIVPECPEMTVLYGAVIFGCAMLSLR